MRRVMVVLLLVAIALVAVAPAVAQVVQGSGESKRIVEVTGTVGTAVNAKGDTRYTLETDDARYWLGAGPDWYYGSKSNYPLEPYVGKTVTVASEGRLEAISITGDDGQTQQIRPAEGEPPWADGPEAAGR